jgi:Trypsin-co-occurring domain 2
MQIPLSDAIQQLRDELRKAILEGEDQDIIFTPNGIDIELGISFATEAKVNRESEHKIKLSLSVADKNGQPLKVRSHAVPKDLPR